MAGAGRVERVMTEDVTAACGSAGSRVRLKSPTRREQLQKLLNRKSGATVAQIQKAFGWQPHTARAASSVLRKAGHTIERNATDKGSVYRIVSQGAAP